ncbi:hypothetical protein TSAR_009352 [Trichomalopsis sarcophagae]|uniref:Uncharacterized protein n=1 Tax=Trichomalopsis sarcophagae TaxID=543379 RepID=A0A232EWI0_9HYME|nr:hypothetical protein TSAR_009352 [Trichomalopsis sarcophagae]
MQKYEQTHPFIIWLEQRENEITNSTSGAEPRALPVALSARKENANTIGKLKRCVIIFLRFRELLQPSLIATASKIVRDFGARG